MEDGGFKRCDGWRWSQWGGKRFSLGKIVRMGSSCMESVGVGQGIGAWLFVWTKEVEWKFVLSWSVYWDVARGSVRAWHLARVDLQHWKVVLHWNKGWKGNHSLTCYEVGVLQELKQTWRSCVVNSCMGSYCFEVWCGLTKAVHEKEKLQELAEALGGGM